MRVIRAVPAGFREVGEGDRKQREIDKRMQLLTDTPGAPESKGLDIRDLNAKAIGFRESDMDPRIPYTFHSPVSFVDRLWQAWHLGDKAAIQGAYELFGYIADNFPGVLGLSLHGQCTYGGPKALSLGVERYFWHRDPDAYLFAQDWLLELLSDLRKTFALPLGVENVPTVQDGCILGTPAPVTYTGGWVVTTVTELEYYTRAGFDRVLDAEHLIHLLRHLNWDPSDPNYGCLQGLDRSWVDAQNLNGFYGRTGFAAKIGEPPTVRERYERFEDAFATEFRRGLELQPERIFVHLVGSRPNYVQPIKPTETPPQEYILSLPEEFRGMASQHRYASHEAIEPGDEGVLANLRLVKDVAAEYEAQNSGASALVYLAIEPAEGDKGVLWYAPADAMETSYRALCAMTDKVFGQ